MQKIGIKMNNWKDLLKIVFIIIVLYFILFS